MAQILNFKWDKGVKQVYPEHTMVRNWRFSQETEDEAVLANSIAVVAEKNGITINELHHIFPTILRILKSDIEWANNIK